MERAILVQSFLKEVPLCLILGCVSKNNLKTHSPAAPSLCVLLRHSDTFQPGSGFSGVSVLPCEWERLPPYLLLSRQERPAGFLQGGYCGRLAACNLWGCLKI